MGEKVSNNRITFEEMKNWLLERFKPTTSGLLEKGFSKW